MLTAELLVRFVAGFIALALERFPVVSTWWAEVPTGKKQLVVAGVFLLVGVGAFALSCAGFAEWFVCTQEGAFGAAKLVIDAIVAGGGVYLLVRKK